MHFTAAAAAAADSLSSDSLPREIEACCHLIHFLGVGRRGREGAFSRHSAKDLSEKNVRKEKVNVSLLWCSFALSEDEGNHISKHSVIALTAQICQCLV